MTTPVTASRSDVRRRILDAALDRFLADGAAGASIEEVRLSAGVSVGSLYHHFGGKEELAGAVYVDALASFQAAFVAELRRHADAEDGVRGGVRAHMRWCLRDDVQRARFLLFHGDAARGRAGEALRERNREFFDTVLEWWRPHARYGALRDLSLELVSALWLGPAQELCRMRLAGRTDVSPRRAERVLADGAWESLRARGG